MFIKLKVDFRRIPRKHRKSNKEGSEDACPAGKWPLAVAEP